MGRGDDHRVIAGWLALHSTESPEELDIVSIWAGRPPSICYLCARIIKHHRLRSTNGAPGACMDGRQLELVRREYPLRSTPCAAIPAPTKSWSLNGRTPA